MDAPDIPPAVRNAARTQPGMPAKLLIIEDNPTDQRILQRMLSSYDLAFVSSGEEGLALLTARPETFDLVILDYNLPRMNGDQVLGLIRDKLLLQLPVVIITGHEDQNVEIHLIEVGDHDYISKDDLATQRLNATVRRSLQRHWLMRERQRVERELTTKNQELEIALRRLQEAQAQLVQHEKMVSLGQLVAGVAHEVNNPLAYVSNNLAVLERDVNGIVKLIQTYHEHFEQSLPDPILILEERLDLPYTLANLERLFTSSKHGVNRVREIVHRLRDFSRLDESSYKYININESIRAVMEMAGYQAREKGVEVRLNAGEIPEAYCNPGPINQVFLNILHNAIQAVPAGTGVITISSSEGMPQGSRSFGESSSGPNDEPDSNAGLFSWSSRTAHSIEVRIADNGPGIPEAIRTKIFDPFFTTKPRGVGTGLGLWISYNILQEHRGKLSVESCCEPPNNGTCFLIKLPVRITSAGIPRA